MNRWDKYSDTYKANYAANPEIKLNKNLQWKERNPHKFLYNSCMQRARKLKLDFDITPEDIHVPSVCPIFNQPLIFATRHSPSVDRIDNSKGYIKGNIVVISQLANKMKNCATSEELTLFCQNVQKVLDSNMMKNREDLNDLYQAKDTNRKDT